MKIVKYIMVSCLLCSTVYAQDSLSLDDYRTKVIGYSLELKKAKEDISGATYNLQAAKTGYLPRLDGTADLSYMLKKMAFNIMGGELAIKPLSLGIGAAVSQNVYSGSAVKHQTSYARIQRDIAMQSEELTMDNIVMTADIYYWNAAAYQKLLEVSTEYYNIIKDLSIIVGNKFTEGLIAESDVLMVDTRLKEAELQLNGNEQAYTDAIIALNTMMGRDPSIDYVMIDNIESDIAIPISYSLDQVLAVRPEYVIARKMIDLNVSQMKLAGSQYLPQLALGVNGSYGTLSFNTTGEKVFNSAAFATLKVPIFHFGERRKVIGAAKSSVLKAEFDLQQTNDQISSELSVTWNDLQKNIEKLRLSQESFEIARQSLNLNTFSYNEGVISILDVLSSQLSWLYSYNSVISSNLGVKASTAQYIKATGGYSK